MMPRTRNILLIVAALLVAGIVALVLFWPKPAPPAEEPTPEPLPPGGGLITEPTIVPEPVPESPLVLPEPVLAPTDERLVVRQNAEIFAERYASYSNQGDYQNLRDLLLNMTARLRAETEVFIAEREGRPPPAAYEGVTSVKVTSDFEDYDADAGTSAVIVSLQQTKTTSAGSTVSYANLEVELVKESGVWKVDRATMLPS